MAHANVRQRNSRETRDVFCAQSAAASRVVDSPQQAQSLSWRGRGATTGRTTRRLTGATCERTKRESSSGSVLVDQGMPWVGQAGARGLGQLTGSVKVPGHSHSLSSGRLLASLAVSSIWSGSCLSRPVLHVWPFVESRRTANRGDLQPEVSRGTLDCTDHSAQAGQRWSRGVPRFLPPT